MREHSAPLDVAAIIAGVCVIAGVCGVRRVYRVLFTWVHRLNDPTAITQGNDAAPVQDRRRERLIVAVACLAPHTTLATT